MADVNKTTFNKEKIKPDDFFDNFIFIYIIKMNCYDLN